MSIIEINQVYFRIRNSHVTSPPCFSCWHCWYRDSCSERISSHADVSFIFSEDHILDQASWNNRKIAWVQHFQWYRNILWDTRFISFSPIFCMHFPSWPCAVPWGPPIFAPPWIPAFSACSAAAGSRRSGRWEGEGIWSREERTNTLFSRGFASQQIEVYVQPR